MTPGDPLPPLVLACRPARRFGMAGAALLLMGLGVAMLASTAGPGEDGPEAAAAAAGLLLSGAGCAHLFLRHGLSRLVLDDRGFGLDGPFRSDVRIAWRDVVSWERRRTWPGPPSLRIVAADGRRLTVPLVYESAHLLMIGLAQRGFPRV